MILFQYIIYIYIPAPSKGCHMVFTFQGVKNSPCLRVKIWHPLKHLKVQVWHTQFGLESADFKKPIFHPKWNDVKPTKFLGRQFVGAFIQEMCMFKLSNLVPVILAVPKHYMYAEHATCKQRNMHGNPKNVNSRGFGLWMLLCWLLCFLFW